MRSSSNRVQWAGGLAGVLALLAASLLSAGCQSQPQGEQGYVQEYRDGQYASAYSEAQAAYNESDGVAKERAACVAGISAYSMGKRDLAEQWLRPIASSSDNEVSGTANWTLGLIAADRNQHAMAVPLYDAAIPKLRGDDAANAGIAAAESLQKLNRPADARQRLDAALASAQSDTAKAKVQQRLAGNTNIRSVPPTPSTLGPAARPGLSGNANSFVIQLGAFGNRASADKLARSSAGAASRAGQPAPRVVATTDPKTGASLFAVRVGVFANRPAAEAALRQMNVKGTVMAGNS